jgi:hypothetical protein
MKIKTRKPKNKGGALVLMTGIGVAMMILSLTIILLGGHGRLMAARTGQRIRARTAADAGLTDAIFEMNKKLVAEAHWDNSTLPSDSATVDPMPASFNYTVSGSPPSFTITSTGTSGYMQENVYVILFVDSFWHGVGVKETVDIKLGTEFGTLPEDGSITIRTNSTESNAMTFKAFVNIPGDVIYGPGGDGEEVIDAKATTVIEGQTYAAAEELTFPDVTPPDDPVPTYVATPITTDTTIAGGSWQYDYINLGNSAILEITGPTVLYITGTTTLNYNAEIIVRVGGSLDLYLGDDLVNQNSVGFSNENEDSTKLKIYGLPGCTEMDLKAKSDFYGAVYAPNANIDLFNSGDFIGAIVGNSFDMKNSGRFIYDTSLASVFIDDPAACFTVQRWWED